MLSYDSILNSMICEYKKLSGSSPLNTSDLSIRFKVLASQLFSLYKQLEWTKKQMFPQTASGNFLNYHSQTRGLERKPASHSFGQLIFSISEPISSNIIIPPKTICFSNKNLDIKFITIQQEIIPAGDLSVCVESQSVDKGYFCNTPAGTISNIINPPSYVASVTNSLPFCGGSDQESDESLRSRLLDSFLNISNGSNAAFYYNLAMNHECVSSVNVIPRNRGRGTVDIIISTNSTHSLSQTIEQLTDMMQKQKEINVDINILPAKPKEINISINIDTNISYDYEQLKSDITNTIKNFVQSLKVAQPLNLAALGAQIFKIPGIDNYKFINLNNDIYVKPDEIITLNNVNIKKS